MIISFNTKTIFEIWVDYFAWILLKPRAKHVCELHIRTHAKVPLGFYNETHKILKTYIYMNCTKKKPQKYMPGLVNITNKKYLCGYSKNPMQNICIFCGFFNNPCI